MNRLRYRLKATAVSNGQGAEKEITASYLRNPAPRYPVEARRNGWQGTVSLKVKVNKAGEPAMVEVKQTSGQQVLDEAAVKTVKTWRYHPAHLGSIPVESVVEYLVRFDLTKS